MSAVDAAPYAMLSELPTLSTPRLRLRWLRQTDVDALYAVFGDPVVMRYWSTPPLTARDQAQALLEQIWQLFANRQLYQWGIALAENDQVIGTFTLNRVQSVHRRAEIGFALGSAWQNCGYAGEALTRLRQHAVDELQLERLEADVDPRNAPSLKLLEKLGFRREGLLRARWRVGGEVQDSVLLGWLKADQVAQHC